MYSALVGWTATRALPSRLRPLAYRAFARAVGANLEETELALGAYPSLGDFFARRLRAGARTVDGTPDSIIAPCDGVVAACGVAIDGALIQAKGRSYRVADLVADEPLAEQLAGGSYMTIYLSPRDYHRVHAPVDARVVGYHYLPGSLWPVNPRFASRVDGLLARNERVVIHLNSDAVGDVALVMVGAAGVGNIRLAPALQPVAQLASTIDSASLRSAGERYRVELEGVSVGRGDELGAFRLGSTVVIVFEPQRATFGAAIGDPVRFGQRIGGAA